MMALVTGIVVIILSYLLARQWLDNRGRSRVVRALSARASKDWHESCRVIALQNQCPPEEIERVWQALANHYGIEADRLAPDDRLSGVLNELFGHPDYELMFVLPSLPQVLDRAEPSPKTWGELVIWMWWHEKQAAAHPDRARREA